MKGWRAGLAMLAAGAALLAPSAQSQTSGRTGADGLPRRPIPYTQLTRPNRPASARQAPAARSPSTAGRTRVAAAAAGAAAGAAKAQPSPLPGAPPVGVAAGQGVPTGPALTGPALALPPRPNGARLSAADALPPAELESFVDGALRQAMAAEHIPGLTVSVVQNGQIVLAKGYGEAVLAAPGGAARRVDPNLTLFRLGGASRLLTVLAALKAVEQGRIKLDQPVNYLLQPALRIVDDDVQRPILVRHLMTQTAGFEARTLGRLYTADPARLLPPEAVLTRQAPRRVFAPGEVSSESAYTTTLLGAILAGVAKTPFDQLIETELTGPLRLSRTTFRGPYPARPGLPPPMPTALARDLALEYRWTRSGFEALPTAYAETYAPAAAASTTAVDMARLMTAMLNGGALEGVQVYGPGVARLLQTPFQTTPQGINTWPGGLVGGQLPGGFRAIGYSGATLGSRAAITVAPQLRLGVFVAANSPTASAAVQSLAGRIVERFYQPPPAALPAGDATLARQAGLYAGRYVSSARARHGLERVVDRLTRGAEVRVTSDGRLILRQDGRATFWLPEAVAPGGGPWIRFRAAEGEQRLVFALYGGRAVAFTPSDNRASYTRVSWFLHPRAFYLGGAVVAVAALLTLAGLLLRFRKETRRTDAQLLGGALQAVTAVLWLGAIAAFVGWRRGVPDMAALALRWPGALLIVASSLALLAFGASIIGFLQLLEVWRTDRRGGGWSRGRRARHTITALIFAGYGVLLALWGALTPWSP